jgi:hypothetical protein
LALQEGTISSHLGTTTTDLMITELCTSFFMSYTCTLEGYILSADIMADSTCDLAMISYTKESPYS